MKKLLTFISLICILNALTLAGLAGFLWGTGRLDKGKVQTIGDMLKKPGTPEGFREKVYDLLTPVTTTAPATTSAPALQPALAEADTTEPATAADRIDYTRKVMEEQRLRLEAEAQNVRHQHELLAQTQAQLEANLKEFKEKENAFEQRAAAANTKKDGNGFETTMALFEELKPKQVKDLLAAMTQDDAVRYVTAMDPDRAAKIVTEFKTPDERIFIGAVLDKIRGGSGGPSIGGGGQGAQIGTGAASGPAIGGGALSAANSPAPSVKAGQ